MASLSLGSAASSWLLAKQQAAGSHSLTAPPSGMGPENRKSKSEGKLMGKDNGGLISEGKSKGKKKNNEKK